MDNKGNRLHLLNGGQYTRYEGFIWNSVFLIKGYLKDDFLSELSNLNRFNEFWICLKIVNEEIINSRIKLWTNRLDFGGSFCLYQGPKLNSTISPINWEINLEKTKKNLWVIQNHWLWKLANIEYIHINLLNALIKISKNSQFEEWLSYEMWFPCFWVLVKTSQNIIQQYFQSAIEFNFSPQFLSTSWKLSN